MLFNLYKYTLNDLFTVGRRVLPRVDVRYAVGVDKVLELLGILVAIV